MESTVFMDEAIDFEYVEFKQIVQILAIFAVEVLLSAVISIGENVFQKIKKMKQDRNKQK